MFTRALPLAALFVALAAFSTTADEPKKAPDEPKKGAGTEPKKVPDEPKKEPAKEPAKQPKDGTEGPAVQKLKQAEEAYRAAREEAYKELAEAEKKVRGAMEKALQDFAKAGPNKDARTKAREDMAKAQEQLEHLSKARMRVLFPSFGPVLAALPPAKEETRFGARFIRPGELLSAHLNLEKGRGLVIEKVEKDQAAEKAGLKAYDVLVEVNGKPVPTDIEQFRKLLAEIKPDTAVTLVVLRQGKSETIKDVKLPAAQPTRP
jgi:C-terminal processing protease CtpA/Prc